MKSKTVYELNRIQRYMMQMRPVLYKQVLFSDGTADYRQPPEPKEWEEVTIRFRTKKDNVDAVFLCGNGQEYQMKKVETCEEFDYYAYTVTMTLLFSGGGRHAYIVLRSLWADKGTASAV